MEKQLTEPEVKEVINEISDEKKPTLKQEYRKSKRRKHYYKKKRLFNVEIKFFDEGFKLDAENNVPSRGTSGSAGYDLRTTEDFVINSNGMSVKVKTGVGINIPKGFCGLITPRSGLSTKGLSIINTPGVIDSDYRGEIMINLVNHNTNSSLEFKRGDKIAQLLFIPVKEATFKIIEEFTDDGGERGEGGFGSTGI